MPSDVPEPLVVIPIVDELPRLDECIAAVVSAGVSATRIAVVADGGGSAAAHSRAEDDVLVIGTPHRRGYAAACNHGARRLITEHGLGDGAGLTPIVLLNDDAVLGSGWRQLLDLLADPEVGAVSWPARGPRGPRKHYPSSDWRHSPELRAHTGPTLSGCAFAITLERWDELGGLDERFTMYGEETDVLRTLQHRGLALVEGGPTVWHEGEGSAGGRRVRTSWYGIRNPIWVAILHDAPARIARTIAVTIADTLAIRRLPQEAEAHRRRRRAASWPVRLVLLVAALGHTAVALPSLVRGRAARR